MTIYIDERALIWMVRWGEHNGVIGSDDQGRLTCHLADGQDIASDPVAADMLAELRGDQALADDVGRLFIAYLQNVDPSDD